ncbi:glycogen debranching protein [Patescibacteria group bacterium]|jgi:glycogen debranching enzyme|nr:glycogen debranching protein [Patescibacteria group bacterium]
MERAVAPPPQAEAPSAISDAHAAARALLATCRSPWGFAASGDRGGYHNLWARDAMITSLGALALDDPTLHASVRDSLVNLRAHQSELGLIPNKIDFGENVRVNFRAYGDGGLWFALICARYLTRYPEDPAREALCTAAERALHWMRHQDHDQSGLVAIQEGASWMDLFPLRGKSLYVNVLRAWASQELGQATQNPQLCAEADAIRTAINEKLWWEPGTDVARIVQDSFSTSSYDAAGFDALGRKLLLPERTRFSEHSYYLPYLTLRDFGEWFDTLGNLLAILSGVADTRQSEAILSFIDTHALAAPYPTKAMHPPLAEGDPDWRYYFRFGDLNHPHQYHNGGIWPMIGGFHVAALAGAGRDVAAHEHLTCLARANRDLIDEAWEFNEYLHGQHGHPMGMQDQAWSAGTFLLAFDAVSGGQRPTKRSGASAHAPA